MRDKISFSVYGNFLRQFDGFKNVKQDFFLLKCLFSFKFVGDNYRSFGDKLMEFFMNKNTQTHFF